MTLNFQDMLSGLDISPRAIQSPDDTPNEPEAPREVNVVQMPAPLVKGNPIRVCTNVSRNKLIETEIDMRNFNVLHVQVRVTGTGPSATITVMGADDSGSFLTVADANGTQTGVSADDSFEVQVGAQRAKIDISAIAGTFTNSQGFTIIVTPFIGYGYATSSVAVTSAPVYTAPTHGELQGSATALQLPNVPCRGVFLKAAYDNVGRVYIGTSSSVTVKDGTTDTTTGYELNAGNEIFIPVDNLNRLYRICDNAGDDLTYFALVL